MKCLLHIHTKEGSPCSVLSSRQLINIAKKKNFKCVMVTDHNQIFAAEKLKNSAPFKIIVGEEIKTKEGEIIGIFLQKRIKPGLSLRQTIREIKNQRGLVYLPHPICRLRKNTIRPEVLESILPQVDIIETYNARTVFDKDNIESGKLIYKHQAVVAAGSDAHSKYELGTFEEMEDFNTPLEFLESLKKAKRIKIKSPWWVHLISKTSKVIRKVFKK